MYWLYELSNHPGNVTTTFSENIEFREEKKTVGGSLQTTLYQVPQLISFTDYTPFGLNIDRVDDPVLETKYRYGFNGKEQDDNGEWGDLTHYDYGFRIYNPAIARFLSVDPLSPDYPWYTPYQFAGNMPVSAIDLDGLEPYVLSKKGAQRIANDVNAIFYAKYGDEKAKQAVITKTETVMIPDPNNWFWQNNEIPQERTYLAANENFDWNKDRYTKALRDILDERADDVEVLLLADRRIAPAKEVLPADELMRLPEQVVDRANDEQWGFILGVGGGDMGAYGSSGGPVKLSSKLLDTSIGNKPSTSDYTIGGVFLHEFIYHLHPLGERENREPQAMRKYYNIATNNSSYSTDHPAGSATSNMFEGVHLNQIKKWVEEGKQ